MPPLCMYLSDLFGVASPAGKEESILVSEIKNTLILLLTIVSNESNLFRIELTLKWGKINLLVNSDLLLVSRMMLTFNLN